MSRAGRKRKPEAPRKRGRTDWRQLAEDPTLVAKWHRARDNILAFGADPYLASQAGKLFVFRSLTAFEVEAAKRWSTMLADYDRLVLNISRNAAGSSWGQKTGRGLPDSPEDVLRLQERFGAAQEAILRAGKPALSALNRLCHDEASSSVLPEARKGLAQLVQHFRLQPP